MLRPRETNSEKKETQETNKVFLLDLKSCIWKLTIRIASPSIAGGEDFGGVV